MTGTRRRRAVAAAALLLVLVLPPPGPAGAATPTGGGGSSASAPGKVKADYDPNMGVRITSPDGKVQLTAPVGALDQTATFSDEPIDPPGDVGRGVRLSRGFKLEATATADGRQLNHFAKPLRLVVGYDDADLAAVHVPATALRLFYQDTVGSWVMIPTKVDTTAHTLSADVDHFTTFGSGSVGMSDDFNRPDNTTSLGSTTTGQSWITDGSTWGICSAQACTFAPPGQGNYVRIDTGLNDQHVSVHILPRPAGATGQAGLLMSTTPDWNTNLLYVGLAPSGNVEVWTLVNGVWSSGAIASATTSYTGTTAHTLEAGTSGTSLTVTVDGTAVLGPVTVPATPADGTMAGLYVDTTEPQANWSTYDGFTVTPGP